MYLLITFFAAIIATIVWYVQMPKDPYKVSTLSFMYWGASLMWLVDGFFCIAEGEPFLEMSFKDALLGFTAVICGLIAWMTILLVKGDKINFFYK
ncbi:MULTISPECIES: hypothetical protein [unclassified Sedimentibacter]|uniref:hypothetical protein n=1 Tax=unclassified Sedimentibacter TaxID=2649220 RepID=UPI0027E1F259|nr:hypothetical protein [Sedimentibacter sp. MB35-C1]WMJ76848.1 hypothetical protein RBQ61_14905 [Sedimentibacter sp. MB35-C1]